MAADVAGFIDTATGYANGLLEAASAELRSASQDIQENYISGEYGKWPLSPDIPEISFNLPAPIGDIDTHLPKVPIMEGQLRDVGDIVLGIAPKLTAKEPTLDMPVKPSGLPAFTTPPPSVNTNVTFPEPPSILDNPDLTMPVMVDRPMPVKPSITLPTFDVVAPVNTAIAPADLGREMQERYRQAVPEMMALLDGQVDALIAKYNPRYHTQMAAIEDKLERFMAGGSGLAPAVETAIYERSRDKAHAEYRRLHDEAWSDTAARGFTLPTGALIQSTFSARQALADANARAAQDIAIKQAEMEQANLQFAITTSASLRTTILSAALGYHQVLVSINGQALDAAKSIVGLVVEIYNAQVKEFGLRLEAYRADAAIYETRLKAAMSALDFYRAEIDALQAMTQVDVAKIGVYKSKIEALGVLADVYRSRIQAVQSKAELEKLKIDLFQSQVQSYTALVQAKNSEWQGYQAAVSGEEAKVKIFSEQVQAYTAQWQGYKTSVDAQAESIRAKVSANEGILAQYEAKLKGFSAEVGARADIAKITSDLSQARLSHYQANIASRVSYYGLILDNFKAQIQAKATENETMLKADIEEARLNLEAQKSNAQIAVSVGEAYSAMAQAALSGMVSIVSATE